MHSAKYLEVVPRTYLKTHAMSAHVRDYNGSNSHVNKKNRLSKNTNKTGAFRIAGSHESLYAPMTLLLN